METAYVSESADRSLGARYSTMDNVDGKQARRTGQSSGLGELFEYILILWATIQMMLISPPVTELIL